MNICSDNDSVARLAQIFFISVTTKFALLLSFEIEVKKTFWELDFEKFCLVSIIFLPSLLLDTFFN